jgi:hypothetical protein
MKKGGMKKAERDAKLNEIANDLIAKIKKDEMTRHAAIDSLEDMKMNGRRLTYEMKQDITDKIRMEVGINYALK